MQTATTGVRPTVDLLLTVDLLPKASTAGRRSVATTPAATLVAVAVSATALEALVDSPATAGVNRALVVAAVAVLSDLKR